MPKRSAPSASSSSSSGGAAKKKTHVASDFKRRKAKVGKKAPKALNATDTSFKAASVQVRAQAIDVENANKKKKQKTFKEEEEEGSLILVSSRGRDLNGLLTQLNHHAPAMRTSALEGIKDAVTKGGGAAVRSNLSALFPAVSRCLVDANDTVRTLGLSVLREVTLAATSSSLSWSRQSVLSPFVPLTVAYITSALNSLDQDIKMDGAAAVEFLCTHVLLTQNATETTPRTSRPPQQLLLLSLLPSFAPLLASTTPATSCSKGSGKRKSRKSVHAAGGSGGDTRFRLVLRAMIALLRRLSLSSLDEGSWDTTTTTTRQTTASSSFSSSFLVPDFTFCAGGSRNAVLLLQPRRPPQALAPVQSPWDLPMLLSSNHIISGTSATAQGQSSRGSDPTTTLTILTQLRNKTVEVLQQGNNHGGKGLFLPLHCMQDLTLLVTAISWLWKEQCVALFRQEQEEDTSLLRSGATKVHTTLLEAFPIRDDSGSPANKVKYEEINVSLCSLLSEMGSCLERRQEKEQTGGANKQGASKTLDKTSDTVPAKWVTAVFSYIMPRLDGMATFSSKDASKRSAGAATVRTGQTTRLALIRVIGQLLLSPGQQESSSGVAALLQDGQSRLRLVSKLGQLFFPPLLPEEEANLVTKQHFSHRRDDTWRCSPAARKAVSLLIQLMEHYMTIAPDAHHDHKGVESSESKLRMWSHLCDMALSLPLYLRAWGGRFPNESAAVLWVLVTLARRSCPAPSGTEEHKDDSQKPPPTDFVASDWRDVSNTLLRSLRWSQVLLYERRSSAGAVQNEGDERATREEDKGDHDDNGDQEEDPMEQDNDVDEEEEAEEEEEEEGDEEHHRLSTSALEELPPYVQRVALSLIGLLRYPSKIVLHRLAEICARAQTEKTGTITHDIADYVMQVMHSIRTCISMQVYLSFVLNSMGLPEEDMMTTKKKKKKTKKISPKRKSPSKASENVEPDEEAHTSMKDDNLEGVSPSLPSLHLETVYSRDTAVGRACQYLVRCGGLKILPKLEPALCLWLTPGGENSSPVLEHQHVRARAAVAIVNACLLDASLDTLSLARNMSVIMPKVATCLEAAAIRLFFAARIPFALRNNDDDNDDDQVELSRFLAPLEALLSAQPFLTQRMVGRARDAIQECIARNERIETEAMVRSILHLLKCCSLRKIWLEQLAKDSPTKTALNEIVTMVDEHKIGVFGQLHHHLVLQRQVLFS